MPPFGDIETHRGFTTKRQPVPGPPGLPVLTFLDPDNAPESTSISLRVYGTGLNASCFIFFNGTARGTNFVSETLVETSTVIDAGAAGEKPVWVYDTSISDRSNQLIFTVT